jgi:exonuclease SbcD
MSFKILHTADWHLGKQLHKVDFLEDMNLFFSWLIVTIQAEKIDLLLMSGDLFDQANPSQQALNQYYNFLKTLIPLNCKVIITGGNHDSPQVINAPKELLNLLDVSVIGGSPENIADLFIEVKKGNEKLIVAAVPYLRDRDIRQAFAGETYENKVEQMRKGIRDYFLKVNEFYKMNFKNSPLVIMCHLFAKGASVTDSEREIQIGNQACVEASIFGNEVAYVALGHIHRPQIVENEHIRYSGSPIQLSFSEKKDEKQVVLVEISNKLEKIQLLKIPIFRKLILLTGTLHEVETKIENYQSDSQLTDLIELIIEEENENYETILGLERLLSMETDERFKIVKGKIEFKNKIKGAGSFLSKEDDLGSFQAIDLFKKRIEMDESIDDAQELILAFKEIMENLDEKN